MLKNILIYSYLLTNRTYYEFEKNGWFCSVCKGILSKEIRFRRDLLPHLDKRFVPDREFRAFSSPALEILDRWKARKLNNRSVRLTLNAVGRKLGFPFPLGMHVARHTFAVMALNSARLDVHLISRLLGHSSVTVTEKVYATFLLPTLSSEVREKLSFSEFRLPNP